MNSIKVMANVGYDLFPCFYQRMDSMQKEMFSFEVNRSSSQIVTST